MAPALSPGDHRRRGLPGVSPALKVLAESRDRRLLGCHRMRRCSGPPAGLQRLLSMAPGTSTHGVRRIPAIGPAPTRPGERPVRDVQPTLRAPSPVELVRTTAVFCGELALPTHCRRSTLPEAVGRAGLGATRFAPRKLTFVVTGSRPEAVLPGALEILPRRTCERQDSGDESGLRRGSCRPQPAAHDWHLRGTLSTRHIIQSDRSKQSSCLGRLDCWRRL